MLILLTGAAGKIGSHILHTLLAEEHTVVAVDVAPIPTDSLSKVPESHHYDLDHLVIDLTDIPSVDGLFDQERPFNGVIQFGFIRSPSEGGDPRIVHNNKVTATYDLLWTAVHRWCEKADSGELGECDRVDFNGGRSLPVDV